MNNVIKAINSINSFSKSLIFYATVLFMIACSISTCIVIYNVTFQNIVELHNIATTLIKISATVYTQFVIGAVLMDLFSKNINSD